jgi:hypothetical protein
MSEPGDRESRREYERKRAADPARRAANAEASRRYRERNPEKAREWREANKEKLQRKKREWQAANTDRTREAQRKYYEANKARIAEQQRKWRVANPERTQARHIRSAHGREAQEELPAMLLRQNGCCYLCEEPLPDRIVIDHDHSCCPEGKSCRRCRRGVACDRCNRLIGVGEDSPALLRKIAGNLEAAQREVRKRVAAKPIQDQLWDAQ